LLTLINQSLFAAAFVGKTVLSCRHFISLCCAQIPVQSPTLIEERLLRTEVVGEADVGSSTVAVGIWGETSRCSKRGASRVDRSQCRLTVRERALQLLGAKLVEGLKRLSKSDPLVVCTTEESGEHVIAGCGELHVEICLKDLRDEYAQCEFTVSDPVVSYRETVGQLSSQTCLAKSPNKHNRIYMTAEPMCDELCKDIEEGKLGPKAEAKERARGLREKYEWDENTARKIWCWGPETDGANVVVDATVAIQYLNEIKEHVTSAFQWTTKEGPLCEENMRGVRFNIMDCTLHTDTIHRGAGQIMPPTRRVCFAAELTAKPTLQEPIFLVEITCPQEAMSGVYNCMNLRRGCIYEENPREGTPLVQVKAHLPVSESFGFVAALRQATSGQAFPQCVFSHWENLQGDCMVPGKMEDLILAVRKRKNIKVEMPKLADYHDKL